MIPRLQFAHLPTPLEPLPRLTRMLAGGQMFVKRDDQTGLAFGGNKARKLEYLLADAQTRNARTLITAGAVQSNHCRQTSAAAARHGFDCVLVLSGEPPRHYSGNILLDKLLNAEIIWTEKSQREQVMNQTFEHLENEGRRPYLIPYGGSNPIGAVAYAYAMRELLEQWSQARLGEGGPDWVVFASSSGGTQAGLLVGAEVFGYQGRVLGISVDEVEEVLSSRVAELATETVRLFQKSVIFAPKDVLVNGNYLGGGYGVMGEPEKEAIRMFASLEGLLLDPVYTGRAAAGLIDLNRQGFFSAEDTVLFWHTGGTPALFVDTYRDLMVE
ncbi:MAG: D-cysteine desulfhydrase family protein [Chloroflexota bacterium]